MRQEALRPDTKAILRGTVEWESRRNVLVRYKRLDGVVWSRQFRDREQAHRQFLEWVRLLQAEALMRGETPL